MTTITSAGVGSGLPLEDLITTYVESERLPKENALNKREYELESQISGVGTLKAAVSKFDDILKQLSDVDNFLKNSNTITYQGSSEENLPFSVTTSELVARGTFDVSVDKLAQGSQLKSAALAVDPSVDPVGSGTMSLSAGGQSFDVTVDATDTLEDIRDKINSASDNIGVQANIINSTSGPKLVYNSEVTGTGNDLTVTNDNASLDAISTGMISTKTAQNAEITIDGELLSSSTNKFNNAISGLNIEVNALTDQVSGEKATLSIANDVEGIDELINSFVDGYNELKDQLSTLANPKNGLLAFDSSVRQLQSQLSQFISASNGDAPAGLQSLYELGISVDNTGRMQFSSISIGGLTGSGRLTDALENNLQGVGTLFAGDNGIATKLASLTDSYVGNDGTLLERSMSLEAERSTIEDDRAQLELYLESYEDTLRQRYSALDAVVAQYQSTGNYLTGIFENMNNSNKK